VFVDSFSMMDFGPETAESMKSGCKVIHGLDLVLRLDTLEIIGHAYQIKSERERERERE